MAEAEERRSLIILGVCTMLSLIIAVFAWNKWGPEVTSQTQFKLAVEHIVVPEQPSWILEDVRAAAVRDGGLEGLQITDPSLVEKVEHAFSVQTWVAKIRRIRKRPGPRVEVELTYREPVALVEVLTAQGQRALQPVDGEGYVLPEGFLHANPALIHEFLRISAGYGMPKGPVGTPWGDPHVIGAARICHKLKDHWKQLNLYRVVAVDTGVSAKSANFELHTRGDSRILWGRTPGLEQPGESDGETKLRLLLHYALANPIEPNGVWLDLRAARTALRAAPQLPVIDQRTAH
ncbi:MAG: hypothetical protein KDB14_24080 [Planctomycetales bacterium]|nr:hypothetical protein [Planctomycetales bacterium]